MTEATEHTAVGREREGGTLRSSAAERESVGDAQSTRVADGGNEVGQGPPARRRTTWAAAAALKLLLASVFLVAGVEKASDPRTFAEQIANYQLYSELSAWGAVLLPPIEIAAAVVVLIGSRRWSRSATAVIVGMLLVFTLAIVQAWMRGINTDCGCFGQGSSPVGVWSVLRNTGLLLASALLLWLTTAPGSAHAGPSRGASARSSASRRV